MKKVFTLFFVLGFFSTAFAQERRYDNKDKNHDYTYNNPNPRGSGYDDRGGYKNPNNQNFFSAIRQRDEEIRRINFDFDRRVADVQRDRFLRASQVNRQVSKLEKERRKQLEQVYKKYDNSRNKYSDKDFNRRH